MEGESESESGGWQKSGGLADASVLCCLQAGSWHQHGATRCPHIPPLNHSHHHPSLDCPPFPTISCRPLSPRRHSCWMTSACWCTGAPQRCWRGRTATRGGRVPAAPALAAFASALSHCPINHTCPLSATARCWHLSAPTRSSHRPSAALVLQARPLLRPRPAGKLPHDFQPGNHASGAPLCGALP